MKTQPWIYNKKGDCLFILLPPFLILFIILLFQKQIQLLENKFSFFSWLFVIVFIDVAHVYATLFKVYFKPSVFKERKKLYIILPILCFLIGLLLFSFGSLVFWRVLAYVAVFHFIRQQYGFMRLYSRGEVSNRLFRIIDNCTIYAATGYPMLFWFVNGNRKFNWFVPNEFFSMNLAHYLEIFRILYYFILFAYIIKTVFISAQSHSFNFPKNALILGTCLSWYFGIVYYNNDLVFTLLNVVSHGIPYMALVYLKEVRSKDRVPLSHFWEHLSPMKLMLFYVLFLMLVAFLEEFLWEGFVWNDNIQTDFATILNPKWQLLFVPLLSVPQFTHYILDGIIWKRKSK